MTNNKASRILELESEGYEVQTNAFNESEFRWLKNAINMQYSKRLMKIIKDKDLGNHLSESFPPSKYHEISNLITHEDAWPKPERVLPKNDVEIFKTTMYFNKLQKRFGKIEITDEEYLGYGNVYWRIVRPKIARDVGKLHRDSWFWEIDKEQPVPEYKYKRIKVWVAINCEPGLNGFEQVYRSHLDKDINWRIIEKDGRKKPILDDPRYKEAKLINTANNTAILFDDKLIHGGAINKGTTTRVSIEFTGFIKDI